MNSSFKRRNVMYPNIKDLTGESNRNAIPTIIIQTGIRETKPVPNEGLYYDINQTLVDQCLKEYSLNGGTYDDAINTTLENLHTYYHQANNVYISAAIRKHTASADLKKIKESLATLKNKA